MFRPIAVIVALSFATQASAQTAPAAPAAPAQRQEQRQGERKPQPRPHGKRVTVETDKVRVSDGDTVEITWGQGDREIIRILGIDTPETANPDHDLPYAQSFGYEARAFAMGVFEAANSVEVLRADMLDPYGRTLGYLFVNGRNYSVMAIKARFAEETVTRYGDNGFASEAAEVTAAAKTAGPLPFESPGDYRRRMRDLSRWLRDDTSRRR